MPTPPFWGDVGVKQWSPNFCLGTQNAILLFPKMVTFVKSAHFYAPSKSGKSLKQKTLLSLLGMLG